MEVTWGVTLLTLMMLKTSALEFRSRLIAFQPGCQAVSYTWGIAMAMVLKDRPDQIDKRQFWRPSMLSRAQFNGWRSQSVNSSFSCSPLPLRQVRALGRWQVISFVVLCGLIGIEPMTSSMPWNASKAKL